jgi:predicted metal-dependent peptidase
MTDNKDTLAKASKELMLKEPFYGLLLIMLNKLWSKTIPTMGVGKNGINYQLIVNSDFWESLTPVYQIGLMKHELLHIAFFHLEKYYDFPNKELANIAMDMEINQYIDKLYLPGREMTFDAFTTKFGKVAEDLVTDLKSGKITIEEYRKEIRKIPARGIYIEDYKDLKLDLRAGTNYYYEKLQKAAEKKEKSGKKGEDSLAGPPGNGEGTSGCEALDGMLDNMAGNVPVVCDHESWGQFEGLSEADKKLLRSQTDFHLKEAASQMAKSRGIIPSELSGYIDGLDKREPPKFDWKSYLRRFTGGSTKIYTKKLHRKYNKRFEENPGLKIKPRRHVLVAVDTSGSVSNTELVEFFHEVYHIFKGGSEVTVVQCDAAISSIHPYKKGMEDKIKITGRGGTDFQPVIDYYNENPHKYTCLVYFTDGECPAPTTPRGRLLWVLSTTSQLNDSLPGQTIKLN